MLNINAFDPSRAAKLQREKNLDLLRIDEWMGKRKQNSVKQSACLDMEDIWEVWLASVDCLVEPVQSLVWLVNVSFLSLSFSSFHYFFTFAMAGRGFTLLLISFFSSSQTFWSLFSNCLVSWIHIILCVFRLLIADKQYVSGNVYKGRIHVS